MCQKDHTIGLPSFIKCPYFVLELYRGDTFCPLPQGYESQKSPGLIELSADDKYSPLNRDSLTQPIQIQLSEKQILFSLIFLCICEICIKLWNFSKKMMTHIADVFTKLQTPKNGVR